MEGQPARIRDYFDQQSTVNGLLVSFVLILLLLHAQCLLVRLSDLGGRLASMDAQYKAFTEQLF